MSVRPDHETQLLQGILIAGLRRSGTTIFWETFRKDTQTCCFDEPFHPGLWGGDRQNEKGTWTELGALWDQTEPNRRIGVQPILPLDELIAVTDASQRAYLGELFASGDKVVIDIVRGWNRFPQIQAATASTLVIHLVRSPASWVTAHMLPSGGGGWRFAIGDAWRRRSFFFRLGMFNYWHYQEICAAAISAKHPMWRLIKLDLDRLARAPAYVKLLAFWWAATQTTARGIASLPQERTVTFSMEDFVRAPAGVMQEVYRKAGWLLPKQDYRHVRSARDGWRPESPKWREGFEAVGIPLDFLPGRKFSGEKLLDELGSLRERQ